MDPERADSKQIGVAAGVENSTKLSSKDKELAFVQEFSDDPIEREVEPILGLIRSTLFTAVIGDVLDALGRFHQILPPHLRPIKPKLILAGRAMPVLLADVFGPQVDPFGKLTQALDQLEPGEVYVAAGGSAICSGWGEILTTTAKARGAVGAVIDSYHRDTEKVLAMDWPVFSRGAYAQDAGVRSKVASYRVPIEIGGVLIEPGDLIVGDIDGVIVVPRDIESEVIARSLEKVGAEQVVLNAIREGMSSTEAFHTFGVL